MGLDIFDQRPYRGNMTTLTKTLDQRIESMKELSLGELVVMAGCEYPDTRESLGALTLLSVRDDVADAVARGNWRDDPERCAHEIADGAIEVYTHQLWEQFVDLGAYNTDISDYGRDLSDMNELAGVAIYEICASLIRALDYRYTLTEEVD